MNAYCHLHREREAVASCARCGDFLCTACELVLYKQSLCASCAARPDVDVRPLFPWDDRARIGWPRAFTQTFLGTLLRPHALYAGTRFKPGLPGAALAFGIAVALPSRAVGLGLEALTRPGSTPPLTVPWLGALGVSLAIFALGVALNSVVWWTALWLLRARTDFGVLVKTSAFVLGSVAPLRIVVEVTPEGLASAIATIAVAIGALWLQIGAIAGAARVGRGRVAGGSLLLILVYSLVRSASYALANS